MATELDLTIAGVPLAIAFVLDGRERVLVPTYIINYDGNMGAVTRLAPMPNGPILLQNISDFQFNALLGHADTLEALARWVEESGNDLVEEQTLSLEARKSTTLVPLRPFLGIRPQGESGSGLLRPVGILGRGPSALLQAPPVVVYLAGA